MLVEDEAKSIELSKPKKSVTGNHFYPELAISWSPFLTRRMSQAEDNGRYFNVYKVEYKLEMPDPDMPQPRYHTVIFVETESDKSGFIHHVTGDLVTGMSYHSKRALSPEKSRSFHGRQLLGRVKESMYSQLGQICAQQPPPQKQKKFNPKTMRTEPIKANGDFYQPGEAQARLIKCTEWTVERAIPALRAAKILV